MTLVWLALFSGCVALALFVRVAAWLERRRIARALSMAHASMIRESFGGRRG